MDAAEYKHVVLGLIFLKYISDAFEAERAQGADPEDPDEYRAERIFWVPPSARGEHIKGQASGPWRSLRFVRSPSAQPLPPHQGAGLCPH